MLSYLIIRSLLVKYKQGQHSGAVVSTVASQHEGAGFKYTVLLWSFCFKFAYALCMCTTSLQVFRLPPAVQRHACWCKCECASRVIDW